MSLLRGERRFINKRRFSPPATTEALQAYLCVFCQRILDLDRPHQLSCGDRACYTCLEVLTSEFEQRGIIGGVIVMECPECQQPLQPSEFFQDRAVMRELKSILVICPYQCQWEGVYKEYQNHLQICPLKHLEGTGATKELTSVSEQATPDPRFAGSEVLTGSKWPLLDMSVYVLPEFEGEVVPGIKRLVPAVMEMDRDECVLPSIPCLPQMKVVDDGQRQLCEIDSVNSISMVQKMKYRSTEEATSKAQVATKELQDYYSELALSMQTMQASSYGSVYIWKIPDFTRRRRDAVLDKTISLYSAPFYTSHHGYKLCMRVYLNGDGTGRGSHISLFVCLMKGDFDPLLPWPFRQTITLVLLSQDPHVRDIKQSFKPDGDSSSFRRPVSEMNVASGCPQFCPLDLLNDHAYIWDNTLYLKASVSTGEIEHLT